MICARHQVLFVLSNHEIDWHVAHPNRIDVKSMQNFNQDM